MTEITPCRGRGAVYDAVSNPRTPRDERRKARLDAAALCARCPITGTCPDRVTPPAEPRRNRKDTTMTTETPTPHPTPRLVQPAEPPTTVEALIAWGAAHPTTRVQALASRARAALTDLRNESERESKVAAAEARITRLKAQLVNAEQDLRSAKGTSKPKDTAQPSGGEDYAAIRAWAKANDIEVVAVGRPKREVIDAYHAAHPESLAATG